jgi:hypothetical protein
MHDAARQSRRSWAALVALAGLALLALLLLTGRAAAQFLSPGPLAAAHAKWDGDTSCETCHSVGRGVPNAKCNGCHDGIAKSEAAHTGLHGRKFAGQPCTQCHSDHHGRGFALIRWNPTSFNHDDAGWPLHGAHATTKCSSCHKTKSFLGLSQTCTSCHKDPHGNRFGQKCLGCHDESAWSNVALTSFNHDLTRYPLKKKHSEVKCSGCHTGSPPKYTGIDFASCSSCHKDPHAGKLGAGCEKCHSESGWHDIVLKGGAHPWLSLANGHARTGCGQCHDRGTLQAPSKGRACVSCHSVVHEADFGRRCETCHASIEWLGLARKVGLAAHDKTDYPLAGKHEDVACGACHKRELAEGKRYRGLTFDRCGACHSDPHAGRFAARDRGECGPCHTEAGFKPSRFGVELHATTQLPLAGHHAAVPCAACHQAAAVTQRLDWTQPKVACASCHDNPHGNQFAKEMQQRGCATCHTAAGWDIPNIDHSIWPLTGAHASTACGACHTPSDKDRKAGNGPSYRLAPRACEGCHEDPHRGQFRQREPVRRCEFCHSTTAFAIKDFAHEKLTGYALEGGHKKLECGRCHEPRTFKGGVTSMTYRLGYRGCRDCHADPHRQAAR